MPGGAGAGLKGGQQFPGSERDLEQEIGGQVVAGERAEGQFARLLKRKLKI